MKIQTHEKLLTIHSGAILTNSSRDVIPLLRNPASFSFLESKSNIIFSIFITVSLLPSSNGLYYMTEWIKSANTFNPIVNVFHFKCRRYVLGGSKLDTMDSITNQFLWYQDTLYWRNVAIYWTRETALDNSFRALVSITLVLRDADSGWYFLLQNSFTTAQAISTKLLNSHYAQCIHD